MGWYRHYDECCCCPPPKKVYAPSTPPLPVPVFAIPGDLITPGIPPTVSVGDPLVDEDYEEEIDEGGAPPAVEAPPPGDSEGQLTPEYSKADISGADCIRTSIALANSKGYNHSPSGATWLTLSWSDSSISWDEVTTYDPCTKVPTKAAIWPHNPYQMKGLYQLYNDLEPFVEETAPTIAEIESWNLEVIRLFRRLLGLSANPIKNSPDLYLTSQWSTERKHTSVWNAYDSGSICGPGSGAHCGWQFLPPLSEQEAYFMVPGQLEVTSPAQAEGIFSVNTDIPWSLKMSVILHNTYNSEGPNGHTGPFLRRSEIGINFKCNGPSMTVRVQTRGTLASNPCP